MSHLESIDDDAEKNLIFIVKFSADDVKEANKELKFSGRDVEEIPALVLFTELDRVEVFEGVLQQRVKSRIRASKCSPVPSTESFC